MSLCFRMVSNINIAFCLICCKVLKLPVEVMQTICYIGAVQSDKLVKKESHFSKTAPFLPVSNNTHWQWVA